MYILKIVYDQEHNDDILPPLVTVSLHTAEFPFPEVLKADDDTAALKTFNSFVESCPDNICAMKLLKRENGLITELSSWIDKVN